VMVAAKKSSSSVPGPGSGISAQALWFTEENMKGAVEVAPKLVHSDEF
jgi:hypothetical protein